MGRICIGLEKLIIHRRTEAGLAGIRIKALQMPAECGNISWPKAAYMVVFDSIIGHGLPQGHDSGCEL
jgi:hypothetical protein